MFIINLGHQEKIIKRNRLECYIVGLVSERRNIFQNLLYTYLPKQNGYSYLFLKNLQENDLSIF